MVSWAKWCPFGCGKSVIWYRELVTMQNNHKKRGYYKCMECKRIIAVSQVGLDRAYTEQSMSKSISLPKIAVGRDAQSAIRPEALQW